MPMSLREAVSFPHRADHFVEEDIRCVLERVGLKEFADELVTRAKRFYHKNASRLTCNQLQVQYIWKLIQRSLLTSSLIWSRDQRCSTLNVLMFFCHSPGYKDWCEQHTFGRRVPEADGGALSSCEACLYLLGWVLERRVWICAECCIMYHHVTSIRALVWQRVRSRTSRYFWCVISIIFWQVSHSGGLKTVEFHSLLFFYHGADMIWQQGSVRWQKTRVPFHSIFCTVSTVSIANHTPRSPWRICRDQIASRCTNSWQSWYKMAPVLWAPVT